MHGTRISRTGTGRAAALAEALRGAVRGEVAFDAGSRALVTQDASNYRRVPLGVVAPRDAEDVAAALAVCREHGTPVVARGGGTSIAGQATGVGVVLDFTRHMNRILAVDPAARTAVVQPGVICDTLRNAAGRHGLTFGPDPSTHGRCTIGGMVGNNSCGAHSVAWGTTADNVLALDVLGYRGESAHLERGGHGVPEPLRSGVAELTARHLALLRTGFPDLPRRISGYALDELLPERGRDWARAFTGSEGTLGVLTEATVRLVEPPRARVLAVLGYADESAAADAAAGLVRPQGLAGAGEVGKIGGEHPGGPLTVEGMASELVPDPLARAALPRGDAWLFVEVGGADRAEALAHAAELCRAADSLDQAVVTEPAAQRSLWRVREDASGTATRMPDGSEAWPGWEDCAVPPERLGAYLRDFRALLRDHGLRGLPYGHFGDGCIHVRIDFDLLDRDGVARFRAFSEEIADLVVRHGGSLSGEHGDGLARAELLPRMYGKELVGVFDRFKSLWDPDRGLNPGVIARPAALDANLRFLGLPSRPPSVAFAYPEDGGDFSAAVRRCVGVARCREDVAGPNVMCPSFRATGAEQHSTRGRARLLHEMLVGEVVTDGWRSPEVAEALDLCLSCKGCRSDCPVGVDMATYKAEFLHHHYAGRRRPAAHYAMGRLPGWLRLVAALRLAPLANLATRVPPVAALAKRLAGIAPERPIPRLPRTPMTRLLAPHLPPAGTGAGTDGAGGEPSVLLFPDTFTTYLSPEAGVAAADVLLAAGVRPVLPPGKGAVCCGLTYTTTGQLDRARAVQRRTLDALEPVLDAGLTVTVLEPPCAAALRTDLPELLPDDPRAKRLADAVRTFAETLEERAPDWTPPRVDRPVAGQTHCHQHAVLGDAADRRLRERAGLTGELSAGCCGLAGDFGYTRGHYDVSVACAEDVLLPAVRSAPADAELLADGYSCRTQLAQLGDRHARHLAEVLAEALPERPTRR
ncbi:FAD-binding and (Fe-S)-binding domain-containing protein [Streptomyces sp. B6B3]|uniref:FAD-binding and (Fe-S)-binding domain-containing protein n=1 Tax=Streptomyces sp. B6B3 TaxID=3153570 RepID=UPI00325EABB2